VVWRELQSVGQCEGTDRTEPVNSKNKKYGSGRITYAGSIAADYGGGNGLTLW